MNIAILFILLTLSLLFISIDASAHDKYIVGIDAGSTGSRCFVFKMTLDDEGKRHVNSFPCGKVQPGLSTFTSKASDAASYLTPLLLSASDIIPASYYPSTSVFIKGTAGMRLLSEEEQSSLWEQLIVDLNNNKALPFKLSRNDIGTISGHQEAFYAVLASNYIAGSIDGNLLLVNLFIF